MKYILACLLIICGFIVGQNYEWVKYQVFDCTCDPSEVIIMTGNLGLESVATFKKIECKGHPRYPSSLPEWFWRWLLNSDKITSGV